MTKGWLGGNWYPILLLVGLALMVNVKFLGRFGVPVTLIATPLVSQSLITEATAVSVTLSGLVVAIIARRRLAANWSAGVALKKTHELVTSGVYRYVRHPIYSGMLLMVLGTSLSVGTLGAVVAFIVMVLAMCLKLRDEEALLQKHFAGEYAEYKKRSRMLIPFIW